MFYIPRKGDGSKDKELLVPSDGFSVFAPAELILATAPGTPDFSGLRIVAERPAETSKKRLCGRQPAARQACASLQEGERACRGEFPPHLAGKTDADFLHRFTSFREVLCSFFSKSVELHFRCLAYCCLLICTTVPNSRRLYDGQCKSH